MTITRLRETSTPDCQGYYRCEFQQLTSADALNLRLSVREFINTSQATSSGSRFSKSYRPTLETAQPVYKNQSMLVGRDARPSGTGRSPSACGNYRTSLPLASPQARPELGLE